jgi:hypothetical protein
MNIYTAIYMPEKPVYISVSTKQQKDVVFVTLAHVHENPFL